MRIARFNGGATGLVVDRDGMTVVDVAASLARLREVDAAAAAAIDGVLPAGQSDWTAMIGQWDTVRAAFETLAGQAADARDSGLTLHAADAVTFDAPIASPSTHIYAIGSNTTVHIIRAMKAMLGADLTEADAMKAKTEGLPPFGFTVWPSTVAAHGAEVAPPRGTQKFDYEGECAVYVKTGGRYLEHVDLWGYTAFNDLGVRDTHLKLAKEPGWGPFSLNTPKNFDTGKAAGPWVVVDRTDALDALRCVVMVNGEVRQDWTMGEMIYGFDETLAFLSHGMTLRPGDMLASGTGAGVAIEGGVDGPNWLKPGDVVEVMLEGAGTLRNIVAAW